jgi:3-methyladenine DNA glycosylase AlkC
MSSLLKDIYSPFFYDKFSDIALEVIPSFNKKKFIQQIFDSQWEQRALKDRMKHTAIVLHEFLPKDFEKAIPFIEEMIKKIQKNMFTSSSLEFMFFPDYIENYGLHYFDSSVKAFEFVTQFTSCEFAVRPFIIQYGDQMIVKMKEWSLHENHHVRRLASEGSRPRLPWAMALPALKKNPTAILPILEQLKNDTSEYVRRSVANSLNDIAKDHPNVVIEIAKRWKGHNKETDAIIKHGSRTLLKQGNSDILQHFNLHESINIEVVNFDVKTPKVSIGDYLEYSFILKNLDAQDHNLRLEYGIHYLRQNGQYNKKVFKISERIITANEILEFHRKQSFKLITTRKFYLGLQYISLIVNGKEHAILPFQLVE